MSSFNLFRLSRVTRQLSATQTVVPKVNPVYQHGSFGGFFHSEALPGALPRRSNNPQQPPYGLYPELISGTSFTLPRANNFYTWMYRIRPAILHEPLNMVEYKGPNKRFCISNDGSDGTDSISIISSCPPLQYRFGKVEMKDIIESGSDSDSESDSIDFLDGLTTMAVNGNAKMQDGATANVYTCNKSMQTSKLNRVFRNNDADMLIMPQNGTLEIKTEMGILHVEPLELAIIPRGIVMQINLLQSGSDQNTFCGYVLENFGERFVLPELGPIGISSGLAHTRHFLAPSAYYEDLDESPTDFVIRFQDRLYHGQSDFQPFDVVSWYGNHLPCKYNLKDFMAINTVTYDHPDPSIGSVLSSPTSHQGLANIDFVVFPPRWVCSENTFRPPWFHRNYMSEFMGLLKGSYDAKAAFVPGASSIHNQFTAHGPDRDSLEKGSSADTTAPVRYESTMAFMWESNKVWYPTRFALDKKIDQDYRKCWRNLEKRFDPKNIRGDDPEKYPFDGKWD